MGKSTTVITTNSTVGYYGGMILTLTIPENRKFFIWWARLRRKYPTTRTITRIITHCAPTYMDLRKLTILETAKMWASRDS
jgi:hypothetical protein